MTRQAGAESGCARAEVQAAAWNARCPVGTPVRYWPGERAGEGRPSRTRSAAWALPSGHAVVQVDGQAGAIALTHVRAEPEAA